MPQRRESASTIIRPRPFNSVAAALAYIGLEAATFVHDRSVDVLAVNADLEADRSTPVKHRIRHQLAHYKR